MYSYPEIKTLRGLYLQRNSFTVPDGALEQATNLIVKNDNILSSRRGFHCYFDPSSGTLNNLFNYQDTLLVPFFRFIRLTLSGRYSNIVFLSKAVCFAT